MDIASLTKEDILEFLRKNKDFLKKEFDIDNIMLFGSFARDEETKDSDIDILIESEIQSFDKYIELTFFLEDKLHRKVDVIYIDTVNPFVMRQIKGEIIYA